MLIHFFGLKGFIEHMTKFVFVFVAGLTRIEFVQSCILNCREDFYVNSHKSSRSAS